VGVYSFEDNSFDGTMAWSSGDLIYKALRKKQLARLAALPWNADDLPRFDEDFLAGQKARYQQAGDMGIMP